MTDIGRGHLVNVYIDAMYEMLIAYDFLLEDSFGREALESF